MIASVIVLLITITSLGRPAEAEDAIFNAQPKGQNQYYWPDGKVHVFIRHDEPTQQFVREINYAIEYWRKWTCLEFILHKEKPEHQNFIKFKYAKNHGCEPEEHRPMSCKCRRRIKINSGCDRTRDIVIQFGIQLGLNLRNGIPPGNTYPTFEDHKAINLAYQCEKQCMFIPKCTNGGYVEPNGPKGCAFCTCPKGKTCQDLSEPLKPNNEHEIIKAGATSTFVESTKEIVDTMFDKVKPDLTNVKPGELFDKISDIKKGAIGAGVGTALVDVMTGNAASIPEDVTAAVAESLICSKLEKVFEKAITGGSLAAGFASAAVAIVQKLKDGDIAGALKAGISKGFGTYIGTAIGTFIGTAIGGPFGTFIGAVLGAMLGEAISYLISELLDFLTPFFEAAWTWIKEGVKTVVYYVIVKPILFLAEYFSSWFG